MSGVDQRRMQTAHAATADEHGNVIHEFLQEYGSGWLRLCRFHPAENRIQVLMFDPKTEELCSGTKRVPDRRQHQLEIEYPLRRASS